MDETHHQTKTPNEMNTPPTESNSPENTAVIPDPIFGGMQKAPTEAPVTTSPPVPRCTYCSTPLAEDEQKHLETYPFVLSCNRCWKRAEGYDVRQPPTTPTMEEQPQPAETEVTNLRWRDQQRRLAAKDAQDQDLKLAIADVILGLDARITAQTEADLFEQPKAAAPAVIDKPEHYPEIDPWKLQEYMQSSGDAFLDGRRCDATKYSFRTKGGTLEDYRKDMIKARNAAIAAIARIDYLLTK